MRILSSSAMIAHFMRTGGRLLALDVAPKSVGLAIAEDFMTVRAAGAVSVSELPSFIRRSHPCGLVVGWPVELSGVEGKQCDIV